MTTEAKSKFINNANNENIKNIFKNIEFDKNYRSKKKNLKHNISIEQAISSDSKIKTSSMNEIKTSKLICLTKSKSEKLVMNNEEEIIVNDIHEVNVNGFSSSSINKKKISDKKNNQQKIKVNEIFINQFVYSNLNQDKNFMNFLIKEIKTSTQSKYDFIKVNFIRICNC